MTKYSFHKLLCYLYTDEIPKITTDKCLNLLELANRLCLPRLINLIECRVIEDLTKVSQSDVIETVRNCLQLLEPVKVIITANQNYLHLNKFAQAIFFVDSTSTVAQCPSIS